MIDLLWTYLYIQTSKLHSIFGLCQTKHYNSFDPYLFGIWVHGVRRGE